MSVRSDAWYAVPDNRKRRKENMRLYVRAMVRVADVHRVRYSGLYSAHRRRGLTGPQAQAKALAAVRDENKAEFREKLSLLRGA